jgi:hypothetical protein
MFSLKSTNSNTATEDDDAYGGGGGGGNCQPDKKNSQLETKLQSAQEKHVMLTAALDDALGQGKPTEEIQQKIERNNMIIKIYKQELTRLPPKVSIDVNVTCIICMNLENITTLYNPDGTIHRHPICGDCYKTLNEQNSVILSRFRHESNEDQYIICGECRLPCAMTIEEAQVGLIGYKRAEESRIRENEGRIRAQQAVVEAQRLEDITREEGLSNNMSNQELREQTIQIAETRHRLILLFGRGENPPDDTIYYPPPTYDVSRRCRSCSIPIIWKNNINIVSLITTTTRCVRCNCRFVDTWDADGVTQVEKHERSRIMEIYHQEIKKKNNKKNHINEDVERIKKYFDKRLDANIIAAGSDRRARLEAIQKYTIEYKSAVSEWEQETLRSGYSDREKIIRDSILKGINSTSQEDVLISDIGATADELDYVNACMIGNSVILDDHSDSEIVD